ncbi:hypothetical protein [Paraburkholderia bannensis]|uniref:hypothetical protein n=1 Tax=Paraburkholderia bannensis TaxID=765414 RepID=UPI002AB71E82|nr:hypothetical protein [Paraburkholderia bannensis]
MAHKSNKLSCEVTVATGDAHPNGLAGNDVHPLVQAFRGDPRLLDLIRVRPSDEVHKTLQHDAVPWNPGLLTADSSMKIDALAAMGSAYLATTGVTTFVEVILARIRKHVYAKNFKNERYRNLYHLSARVMIGEAVASLPPAGESLKGSCFSIIGPSLSGKTALLQRIRILLGAPFEVRMGPYDDAHEADSTTPSKMTFIPCLNLSIPKCNTLGKFLSDMRQRIVGEIRNAKTAKNALAQMEGTDGEGMAVAACILLNVCLITVDGANFSAIKGDATAIPEFLVRLQEYTDIPVVISCTSAYEHFMSLSGSLSSNLFGEMSLHLDPIRKPPVDKPELRELSIWYQKVKWYWNMGIFSREYVMPEELPDWTWEFTQGREGWLAKGFQALHVKLIQEPRLLKPGQLTKEEVKKIFDGALRTQAEAVTMAKLQIEKKRAPNAPDFFNFIDHFPVEYIRQRGHKAWLSGAGGRR